MSRQMSCGGVHQTLLILLILVSCTIAQNYTGGDDGLLSVCALSSDQSATIVTTEVNYENIFLMTTSISNLEYNLRFANPDDQLFKSTATAFENEIVSQLSPLIQKPPPSSGTVLLDASVILMSPTPIGQSTGTTLECILSTNDDLMTESFLSSRLRTVAITSSVYPGFVSSLSNSVSYCLREVIMTHFGTLTWPVTLVETDTGTEELCPVGTKYVGERSLGRRSCSRSPVPPGHAQWEPYICLDCGKIIQVDDSLLAIYNEILQNGSIVLDGVDRAGILLNEVEDITESGMDSVAFILEYVAELNVISTQLLDAVLRLLSNLLQQDAEIFRLAEKQSSSSTRIVQSLRTILVNTALAGSAVEYVSVHQNIAASLLDIQQPQIQDEWISFGSVVGPIVDAPLTEGSIGLFTGRTLLLLPNSEAYVHIKVEGPVITDSTNVRTMFVIYHNGKLFQSVNADVTTTTATSTINGRVVTADIRATQSPQVTVITRFKPLDPQVTNVGCRSWDQSLNNGHGDWSGLTCMLNSTETIDRVKCHCDQLAAFTIFADSDDSGTAGAKGVSVIVRVGAVICIICLLAAAILFLIFKEFRSRRELQILCCLFLTLAAFYLILAVGIDQSGAGCIIVGSLLHYCLLAAVEWMGIAWVHLYDLSRRKPWVITWFMVKVSGVVWGFPFLFVIITVAVNPNHYITPTQRCFLSSDPIYNLILTVILPILAMLIAMGVAFGFTARNVILDDEAKPNIEEEEEEGAKAASKFWKLWKLYIFYSTAIVVIILTLVFFIIMVNSSSNGAEYIFGLLAIVKGILIIVIFCIYHRGVRDTLKIKLGYINGPDSTKFQPYWSASKWKSGQGVLPENDVEEEDNNTKKLYLDNTQASGTLTNQRFKPNSVPLSSMEMQRMGQNGVSSHVNGGMVVEADFHTPPDADASV
ncbi:adhesion G-protein coupled receptor G4-like [Asterias rubens]|uniref:adhesion G-protein coupled receptor G4-like n=1 Tax=Asterias rubens TaxID=7604 RepID=UPI001454EAA6|nr:adhesion G-protein coupled receptor G4-like [Asterias rubens]